MLEFCCNEENDLLLVGQKAPSFEAQAYYKGEFTEVPSDDLMF